MATRTTRTEAESQDIPGVPQEPAENLGVDLLLAGQEGNAPPPPERMDEADLGLDKLLEGQVEPPPEPEPPE